MFAPQIYINRREQLRDQVGKGLILLLGNGESPMNYADNTYFFRQDSTFLYFFGINIPNLAAIIDVDEQKEYLFGDDYTIDEIVWRGSQQKIAEYAHSAGIEQTLPFYRLADVIKMALDRCRKIHYLPPYRVENKITISQLLNIPIEVVEINQSVELVKSVVKQREIKSDEEICQIEEAVNISVDMHIAGIRAIRPGIKECVVAAKIHEVALSAGGNIGFPIIATKNGQTLHNHYHGNTLNDGDVFLIDAGAENAMHYNGDLSSTIPVLGSFSVQQSEIYEATLKAHQAAINTLNPGISFKEVHFAACRSIINSMKDLGLMKGNTEDALHAGAHALFFPCGTGHMMGLDVHDMEDLGEQYVGYENEKKSTMFGLKSLRFAKLLQPGHVFTIEPGIYFIPELIDLWQAENKFNQFLNWEKINSYRNMGGYRNEENFVITCTGYKRLGKLKPKTVEEIVSYR
ncbi:MAG: aminopeptidase P N-terminal domain-containing protein [Marinilabiliaceae bacterium]|nr:aminopeptidase P N-terminal domain-containing protein [Marinilabiliaceae bacterium]